ncbi:MAG TPA: DinB family protein [Chloroflexota bacterium]|jgi:hypothetical protein|nr:DinB family protein [Chloroflexota bacterium]
MSLDVLRERLRRAHADFLGAVEVLDPSALERAPAVGKWSARDVAAHLADWNEEILLAAEHLLGAPKPAHHPIADIQAFNEAQATRHLDEPWAAAKARLDQTVARAIELSGRFADRLGEPVEHPWNDHGTIRDLFHGVCGHQEEHTEELRAWRRRRPSR